MPKTYRSYASHCVSFDVNTGNENQMNLKVFSHLI